MKTLGYVLMMSVLGKNDIDETLYPTLEAAQAACDEEKKRWPNLFSRAQIVEVRSLEAVCGD